MVKLHSVQKKLLRILKNNINAPLPVRELQDELDLSSTSVVQHHIEQLERKGFLKRNPQNPKDYVILGEPEKEVIFINKYGLAHCGPTRDIVEKRERFFILFSF